MERAIFKRSMLSSGYAFSSYVRVSRGISHIRPRTGSSGVVDRRLCSGRGCRVGFRFFQSLDHFAGGTSPRAETHPFSKWNHDLDSLFGALFRMDLDLWSRGSQSRKDVFLDGDSLEFNDRVFHYRLRSRTRPSRERSTKTSELVMLKKIPPGER